jgi:hypothetical protein
MAGYISPKVLADKWLRKPSFWFFNEKADYHYFKITQFVISGSGKRHTVMVPFGKAWMTIKDLHEEGVEWADSASSKKWNSLLKEK